jgi:hypothetical protein
MPKPVLLHSTPILDIPKWLQAFFPFLDWQG